MQDKGKQIIKYINKSESESESEPEEDIINESEPEETKNNIIIITSNLKEVLESDKRLNTLTIVIDGISNNITTFKDNEGHLWFVGNDVGNMLGFTNTRQSIRTYVEIEDKLNCQEFILKIGNVKKFPTKILKDYLENIDKKTKIINKSGFYSLALNSTLLTAKKFKRWVTGTLLPELDEKGYYFMDKKLEEVVTKIGSLDFKEREVNIIKVCEETNALRIQNKKGEIENKKLEIDTIIYFCEALKKYGGMDDRDDLNTRDRIRNVMVQQPYRAAITYNPDQPSTSQQAIEASQPITDPQGKPRG